MIIKCDHFIKLSKEIEFFYNTLYLVRIIAIGLDFKPP